MLADHKQILGMCFNAVYPTPDLSLIPESAPTQAHAPTPPCTYDPTQAHAPTPPCTYAPT